MNIKPVSINWFKWLGILPAIAALIEEIVKDVKDGRIDAAEVPAIGEKLIVIVSKVV